MSEKAAYEKVVVPWDRETVDGLNRYQQAGWMHPFTCGNGHGDLLATPSGWVCSSCMYRQNWAYAWMVQKAEEGR